MTPWTVILQARILEWVAFPFSRGSSQPGDQTQVSHIAGEFLTVWATKEGQEYWSGEPIPSPAELPDLGIKLGSPALQADSLPSEPQGKFKNTGVGSLSLLQGIFSTQESNWGLLHSRQILYQLSYHGSPPDLYSTCSITYLMFSLNQLLLFHWNKLTKKRNSIIQFSSVQ